MDSNAEYNARQYGSNVAVSRAEMLYNLPRFLWEGQPPNRWCVVTLAHKKDQHGNQDYKKGKPVLDKAPRHPSTLALLDTTRPDEWGTIEEAHATLLANPTYRVGRVWVGGEGIVGIDIDAPPSDADPEFVARLLSFQDEVRTMWSHCYRERSQSGEGEHILVQANLNGGYRQPGFEVYGHQRYFIMTGDVLSVGHGPRPDDQPKVDELAEYMEKNRIVLGEFPDDTDDTRTADELIERASKAKNGRKFLDLMNYEPTDSDDRSRLDAALASMIAFWTKSHRLAIEVFARSRLWRGDGATIRKRGYESPEKYVYDYLLDRTFRRAWSLRARDEEAQSQYARASINLSKQIAEAILAQSKGK